MTNQTNTEQAIAKMYEKMAKMQQDMARLQTDMTDELKKLAQADGQEQSLKQKFADNRNDPEYARDSERIAELGEEITTVFKGMIDAGRVELAAICVSAVKGGGSGTSCLTTTNISNMKEEELATALDVFTNPRRINILKLLLDKSLSSTEISQQTGLVGGQLYHHLNILENTGLLEKTEEKYRTKPQTWQLLASLYAAVGGMDMARN